MPGPPWLILPTYNEAENLETVVTAARSVLAAAAPEGFRILVVDDDSPDGTGAIADRLAAAHPGEVEVLHRPPHGGLGPAYLAGFGRALDGRAGYVLQMDADLSHDPADLARLLAAARAGAGLALGSRYAPGGGIADWGRVRRARQPRRVVVRTPRARRGRRATSPAASSASAPRRSPPSTSRPCARTATPSRSS